MSTDVPTSPSPTPSRPRIRPTHPHVAAAVDDHDRDLVGVLRIDDDGLVPVSPWPLGDDAIEAETLTPWACVARTGAPLVVDERACHDPVIGTRLRARDITTIVARPVWADRRLVGVVTVFGDAVRPLDEVDEIVDAHRSLLHVADAVTDAPHVDRLTGVAGAGRLVEEIAHGDGDAVVLYVDLDGLDAVNDAYGTASGDAVLVEIARRLDRVTRTSDEVVRTAGDEFVLVIRDSAELASIQIAARVTDELGLPYDLIDADGEPALVSVTAGVGVCVPREGAPFDASLAAALRALCEAKRAGRGQIHIVGT